MKLFAIFMAIYILVLSVVPCSDMYNECANAQINIVLNQSHTETSSQHHDHKQDQNDRCSPFCTCACCHISIITSNIVIPFSLKKAAVFSELAQVLIPYRTLISKFFDDIWQPPKI